MDMRSPLAPSPLLLGSHSSPHFTTFIFCCEKNWSGIGRLNSMLSRVTTVLLPAFFGWYQLESGRDHPSSHLFDVESELGFGLACFPRRKILFSFAGNHLLKSTSRLSPKRLPHFLSVSFPGCNNLFLQFFLSGQLMHVIGNNGGFVQQVIVGEV